MLLLLASAAQPALAQSQTVVIDCLPHWGANDRFRLPGARIWHPSLSLNGFDCGSNCDIGYGLKQVLEKVYGAYTEQEVIRVFTNIVNKAAQPFERAISANNIRKNTEILQAKGFVALAAYVLENNDYDPTTLNPALPSALVAVQGFRWGLIGGSSAKWKMEKSIEHDGLKWATPLTNVARAIDFYLALENAYGHYDLPEYNNEEATILLSKINKATLMNNYADFMNDLEELSIYASFLGTTLLSRYHAEPGNASLKIQVALGYAALTWQSQQEYHGQRSNIITDYVPRAFKAAGREAGDTEDQRRRYWRYQSDDAKFFWAEGPYYFHLTLSQIIPFWHAARINGFLQDTDLHSYRFPDPLRDANWFLNPLHWLADISTPDGKSPPLDDGHKGVMYNVGVLSWKSTYGNNDIGEKFARIAGRIQSSLNASLYPVEIAIPRRALSDSGPPDGIIGNEFGNRTDGEDGRQEVVVRRTIGNKQHYLSLNGESGDAIVRGEGHEQGDQMQLLYYVDDISYLVDSGYDRPETTGLLNLNWHSSTWNNYFDHNVMTIEPHSNSADAPTGGVPKPRGDRSRRRVVSIHQDVDEIYRQNRGNIDLLSGKIVLKSHPSGRGDPGILADYYRNVLFIHDDNYPYIIDINAINKGNGSRSSQFKMYYHGNSDNASILTTDTNTSTFTALRWDSIYASEESSSPDTTNNSLYIQPFTVERPLYFSTETDEIRESRIPGVNRGAGIGIKKMILRGNYSLTNGDSTKYFTTVTFIRALPNGEANPDLAKGNRPLPSDGDRAWQYITWKHDSATVDVIVARSAQYYADSAISSSSPGISYFPVSEADSLYLRLFSRYNYGFARLKKQGQTWSIDPNFKLNMKIFEVEAQVDGPKCIAEGYTGTFTATGSFTNPVVEFVAPYSYNWEYYYRGSCTRDIPCGWNGLNIPGNTNSRTVDFGGNNGEDFDIRVTVTDSSSPAQSIVSSDIRVQVLSSSEGVCPSNPDDDTSGKKSPDADSDSEETLSLDADLLEADQSIPKTYALRQNFPNPFNPSTEILFDLPEDAMVSLVVYDVLGREVARLVQEELRAGTHRVRFDAGKIPSGVYFYRIRAGEFHSTHRMTFLK